MDATTDPHTTPTFLALATDRKRNEAIAGALGWKYAPMVYRWEPSSALGAVPRGQGPGWGRGDEIWLGEDAPPYWTGGDPALCREMRDAMIQWAERFAVTGGSLCWAYHLDSDVFDAWCVERDDDFTEPDLWVFDVDAITESRMWCLALVAAGRVPKE